MKHVWQEGKAYKVLVGKPEENWPIGRGEYKWENEIDIKEKECRDMERINPARERE
jgi:hypothetical protein